MDFTKAKSQLISLLQASRTAYASTVDASKRQFNSDVEIADALIYADGEICTAICSTPGHPFSNAFKLTSAALVNNDTIPSHVGRIINVTHCATSGGTYLNAIPAQSREDIIEMRDYATTYGASAYLLEWHFIEDSTLYIVDGFGKIVYTDYVKTASPQAPESYASGVVAGAIARLLKDGGDDQMITYYAQMFGAHMQEVTTRAKILPQIVEYKK